jgi:hypothetical protein
MNLFIYVQVCVFFKVLGRKKRLYDIAEIGTQSTILLDFDEGKSLEWRSRSVGMDLVVEQQVWFWFLSS